MQAEGAERAHVGWQGPLTDNNGGLCDEKCWGGDSKDRYAWCSLGVSPPHMHTDDSSLTLALDDAMQYTYMCGAHCTADVGMPGS